MFKMHADRSGELSIIPPEKAKEQLKLRARHNQLVRISLDTQEWMKWDDATTFALLACYQADVIEQLSEEVTTLRMIQPFAILMPNSTESKEMLPGILTAARGAGSWDPAVGGCSFCDQQSVFFEHGKRFCVEHRKSWAARGRVV